MQNSVTIYAAIIFKPHSTVRIIWLACARSLNLLTAQCEPFSPFAFNATDNNTYLFSFHLIVRFDRRKLNKNSEEKKRQLQSALFSRVLAIHEFVV